MTHGVTVPHLTWCEIHQKKAFTKDNAKKVVRALRSKHDTGMRKYPCGWISNGWHVGHLHPDILEGKRTAREVYGPRDAA